MLPLIYLFSDVLIPLEDLESEDATMNIVSFNLLDVSWADLSDIDCSKIVSSCDLLSDGKATKVKKKKFVSAEALANRR